MFSLEKRAAFVLLSALSLAGYVSIPLFFPLPGQFDSLPLRDVRSFAPSVWAGIAYALFFLAQYAIYATAWRHITTRSAKIWSIVMPALVFCLPLLFTYPINATDLFRYFVRGRVTAFYGESALVVPPSAYPHDPYLPFAGEWATATSPYGPLWELLAGGITAASGQNLLLSLLLFKSIAILAHSAVGVLIWQAGARLRPSQRAAATLLWTWNPALLFMFAVDGHNDALMIFWLVFGYVLMPRRPLLGFLVAFLGALTKPVALLALPFLFFGRWRRLQSWRARWRYLLAASAGALLLTVVTFAPFGSPLRLATRLLTEASEAVGYSPGVLLLLLAQRLAAPFDVGRFLELGAALGLAVFVLLALLLLWRVWRGLRVASGIAAVFAAYLATAFTFRIWYSTWPFPWLLVDDEQNLRAISAGFWFLLCAHLSLLIYGYLRIYVLAGDQLAAHLVGVPFTFILPLVLARWLPLSPIDRA